MQNFRQIAICFSSAKVLFWRKIFILHKIRMVLWWNHGIKCLPGWSLLVDVFWRKSSSTFLKCFSLATWTILASGSHTSLIQVWNSSISTSSARCCSKASIISERFDITELSEALDSQLLKSRFDAPDTVIFSSRKITSNIYFPSLTILRVFRSLCQSSCRVVVAP